MASATARPTFSFHNHRHHHVHSFHSTKLSRAHLSNPKNPISSSSSVKLPALHHFALALHSIDVSKEGAPTSQPEEPSDFPERDEQQEKLERRRLEEQFVVLNTGIYECRSCGYRYDEAAGDPSYPVPPGLSFAKLPEDWRCPTCGAARSFFESKSVEIAGFAQNQQFGFGGNALTAGQKALLIYGSLFLAFVLFLSGYFLQ